MPRGIFVLFYFLMIFINPLTAKAASYVAEVLEVKGSATKLLPSEKQASLVRKGQRLPVDTSILTQEKSMVKIRFIDRTEVVLGAKSKFVINQMQMNHPGLITLLSGQIKAYVKKEKKGFTDKNKFFIKTKTAALGVRGTKFQTIFNVENNVTTLVTLDGEVAMAKVEETRGGPTEQKIEQMKENLPSEVGPKIEHMIEKVINSDQAVVVKEGQFSGASETLGKVSLPVKISPRQFEVMKEVTKAEIKIEEEKEEEEKSQTRENKDEANLPPAEGFYDEISGDFAPKAGGFIDLTTGLYIPPSSQSSFDEKLKVYLPPQEMGSIDKESGDYIPPQGLVVDAKKGLVLKEELNLLADLSDKEKEKILALKDDINQNLMVNRGHPQEDQNMFLDRLKNEDRFNEEVKQSEITVDYQIFSQELKIFEKNSNTHRKYKAGKAFAVNFYGDRKISETISLHSELGFKNISYPQNSAQPLVQDHKNLFVVALGLKTEKNFQGQLKIEEDFFINSYRSNKVEKIKIPKLEADAQFSLVEKKSVELKAKVKGVLNLPIQEKGIKVKSSPGYRTSLDLGLPFDQGIKLEISAWNEEHKFRGKEMNHQRSSQGVGFQYVIKF